MSAVDVPTAVWQHHKGMADLAFKHGNYPEAAASYTKVIIALNDDKSTRPAVADRVKVYANRSLACLKMADFKEALKDAQVAGASLESEGTVCLLSATRSQSLCDCSWAGPSMAEGLVQAG